MSDPAPDIIDAIFAAFDPGGAGTTKLGKLTGWPVSTIHSWKGMDNIPTYRRLDIVRAAREAHIRQPEDYTAPVALTAPMIAYLDPQGIIAREEAAEAAWIRDQQNGGKSPQGEADKGATRAESHAERVDSGWSTKAYAFLVDYAGSHCRFLGEEVRLAAMASNSPVPVPPAPGAWGNIFKRAARAGLIRKAGFEPSKLASTHGKAAVVWVAL